MKRTVYLAGPIGGCTKGEANDWRRHLEYKLRAHGIMGISPLRCEPVIDERYDPKGYPDEKFGTNRAIGSKNEMDVRMCDMMIAFLPTISMGTLIEIGMAKALNKPLIIVSEEPDINFHPVIQYCASWWLNDLDDAADVVIGVLGDYA